MSTPLTDGINALTAYANETTGASDTTLSDAVGRLCEGYGGGLPTNMAVSQIRYQPESDNSFTTSNPLGEIPDVVILLPITTPVGIGAIHPYAICCYKGLNGAVTDMYNVVVVEFKISNGNWDYSKNGRGWLADSEKIYFKSNSSGGIPTQDYILIAYKYTT